MIARLNNHVVPLEDERAKHAGWGGTMQAKTPILHRVNSKIERMGHALFVEEALGF